MKSKKLKWIAVVGAVAMALAIITVSVLAYFSTIVYVYTNDGDKQKFHAGMRLSLLFDKLTEVEDDATLPFIDPSKTATEADPDANKFKYDSNAKWGTAQNPYVISDIRHLQNLSALQDIGYFYDLNIKNNFTTTDGKTTYNGGNDKPYFLVCKNDGTPVTINGEGISIKPIGTEQYPFIGEIGGAILDGTTTVPTTEKGNLQSDTSAIFNIKVMSKRKMPDHGLFGYVSYLGAAPGTTGYDTNAGTIAGYVSKISGLLMADVTLEVKDTNFVDTVANWMSTHIFSYSALDSSVQSSVPHETHHIGILAGHVNYVDIENISIYYSSDDIVCIDLNDKQSVVGTAENPNGDPDDNETTKDFDNNYFSSTGIIGYVYSMNPQYTGNVISIGTGSSSTSIGNLGGGGEGSGVNPGYVLAEDMYTKYSGFSHPPVMTGDGLTKYTIGVGTLTDVGFKVNVSFAEKSRDENGNVVCEVVYTDELGRKLISENALKSLSTEVTDPITGNKLKITVTGVYGGGGWKYESVTTNGSNTTTTYVSLDDDAKFFYCQVEVDGYDRDGNYQSSTYYYRDLDTVSCYLVTEKDENGDVKENGAKATFLRMYDGATGSSEGRMSSPSKAQGDVTPGTMYLYTAQKGSNGPALCTEWLRDRMFSNYINLGKAPTGRYYYCDGVFTFALSSTGDTISKTWAADELIPLIMLSKNDSWTTGKLPNDYRYETTFTPVTSAGAAKSAENLVILYQSNNVWYIVNLGGTANNNSGSLEAKPITDVVSNAVVNAGGFSINLQKTYANYFDNYTVKYTTIDGKSVIHKKSSSTIKLGVNVRTYLERKGFLDYDIEYNKPFVYAGPLTGTSGGIDQLYYSDTSNTANFTDFSGNACYIEFLNVANRNGIWNTNDVTWQLTRYLSYNGSSYSLAENTDDASRVYLFNVSIDIVYLSGDDAPDSMVPTTNENNKYLSANQYVLWPLQTFSGGTVAQNTEYGLVSIAGLGSSYASGGQGWRYEDGTYLQNAPNALKYLFRLVNGASFGSVESNYFGTGGDTDDSNAFVKAPLGSDKSETYIPMGCISFKVNKKPAVGDPIKIRVIVAVPTSATADSLSANEYAFGLWKNSLYSGQSETFEFDANDVLQKFELPRSKPLAVDPDDGKLVADNSQKRTIYLDADGDGVLEETEKTDANRYTTYFQSETVLVAYEFQVTDVGVYTLGAINCPMQIVYFSADGVASMGRDGTGGAQLEGIDFVYDTIGWSSANKIVTVNNAPDQEFRDEAGKLYENYDYYYESGCLLHFDNEVLYQNDFVNIYHEKIYIRRYYNNQSSEEYQKTVLNFTVEGTELTQESTYVKLEEYGDKHDKVNTVYYGEPRSSTS